MQDVYFGKGPCTYGAGLLLLTFIFYLFFYWIVITGTTSQEIYFPIQQFEQWLQEKKHPAKQILSSVWCLNEGSQSFDRFIRVFPVVLILSAAAPVSPTVFDSS